MRYMGGKALNGKKIARLMSNDIQAAGVYVEPFVGGCNVIRYVSPSVVRVGSDAHLPLVAMWSALSTGWLPPRGITEDDYKAIKQTHGYGFLPLYAYAGFGLSFGGKWWGGYTRDNALRDYNAEAYNTTTQKSHNIKNVWFLHADYTAWGWLRGAVIYCDPPYEDTTGFKGVAPFISNDFWQWVDKMAHHNIVYVSEQQTPLDSAVVVWTNEEQVAIRRNDEAKTRTEYLYRVDHKNTSRGVPYQMSLFEI